MTGAGLAVLPFGSEVGLPRRSAPLTQVPSRLKNGALVHPFRAVSSVGAVLAALPLALGALVTPTITPQAAAAQGQTTLASPQALPTAQIDGVVWDQAVVGNTVYVVGGVRERSPGRCRSRRE